MVLGATALAQTTPAHFPTAALGFQFGSGVEQARAACESSQHVWTEWDGSDHQGTFDCSGPAADVGHAGRTTVRFCGGHLCALTLWIRESSGESYAVTLDDLRNALVTRYGVPAEDHEAAIVWRLAGGSIHLIAVRAAERGGRVVFQYLTTEAEHDQRSL